MTELLTSYDPATGEALGTAPRLDAEAVAGAVARARAAFPAWRDAGWAARRRVLLEWKRAIAADAPAFATLLTRESGKPLPDAMAELAQACDFLGYAATRAERLLLDEAVRAPNPVLANRRTRVHYRPKGVGAVIAPWNYPLLLAMADVAGALAVGNTVLLKPSEFTPLVGLRLAALAREAGMPEGVFTVVTGDAETGRALAGGTIDKLSLTGSVETGRRVAVAAAERLLPVTLELGGKDAALVLDDADVEFASQGLAWAAFVNAGQVCASIERLYVHRAVAPALLARLAERVDALVVGPGLAPDTDVGPLIHAAHLAHVAALVEDAVAKGARVLAGGKALPGPGHFYRPTLLTGVTSAMRVMTEETFGPVLTVSVLDTEDAMIEAANGSPWGLSASVWTADRRRGERLAARLEAGTVWVNTAITSYGFPDAPRSGRKLSGLGHIGGRLGLLGWVDAQLVDAADAGAVKPWWFPAGSGAYAAMEAAMRLAHGPAGLARLRALADYLAARRR